MVPGQPLPVPGTSPDVELAKEPAVMALLGMSKVICLHKQYDAVCGGRPGRKLGGSGERLGGAGVEV